MGHGPPKIIWLRRKKFGCRERGLEYAPGQARFCRARATRADGVEEMIATTIRRHAGRALAAIAILAAGASAAVPTTAYARHGEGAAIALGILGGAILGGAVAQGAAPAPSYYAPAPAYYYSPPPQPYYYAAPTYYAAPAYDAPRSYYRAQWSDDDDD